MISGNDLKNAIISGANNVLKYRSSINELNIFPVPDGDTGSNMSMTIGAAVSELEKLENPTAAEAANTAASAMLRGARGNSGVILSILFRGFSDGLKEKESASAEDLVNALGIGVEAAYKAVMKPTEGTILTVSRMSCGAGRKALQQSSDPAAVWQAVCSGAEEALEQTPEQLPVLKRAGVVDAGGKGLCSIFEGMQSVFCGGEMIEAETQSTANVNGDDFFRNAAAEFDEEIHFTYCTEFIIGRDSANAKDPSELRAFLETMGDCVLVVSDDEIIKVHVHTEHPGKALEAALDYGQLLSVKVDNMKEQHRKAAEAEKKETEAAPCEPLTPADPVDEIGFTAVASGSGLKTLFTDLGCCQVVSGGQTMNPSTEMLAEAVRATPAKNVMILPNNKNIILAAEQVVPLVKDRKVVVLPTRTIPQGLSALLAYNPDISVEENTVSMMESATAVRTGTVTYAARDSEFGGRRIHKNDVMGLVNGKLEIVDHIHDVGHVCVKLVRSMMERNTTFITLIYGQEVSENEANDVYNQIKSKIDGDVEVTLVNGGQPVYYYIVSVE